MATDTDRLLLLFLVPAGVLLLANEVRSSDYPEPEVEIVTAGKESYYLKFNKDAIFKNLLATEEHLQNVKATGVDSKGFMNCAVKHTAMAESHADEAISHSQVVDKPASNKFRALRDSIKELRDDIQFGNVSPGEGISRVRKIRHQFEAFNPDYDVSRCKACEIRVEMVTKI